MTRKIKAKNRRAVILPALYDDYFCKTNLWHSNQCQISSDRFYLQQEGKINKLKKNMQSITVSVCQDVTQFDESLVVANLDASLDSRINSWVKLVDRLGYASINKSQTKLAYEKAIYCFDELDKVLKGERGKYVSQQEKSAILQLREQSLASLSCHPKIALYQFVQKLNHTEKRATRFWSRFLPVWLGGSSRKTRKRLSILKLLCQGAINGKNTEQEVLSLLDLYEQEIKSEYFSNKSCELHVILEEKKRIQQRHLASLMRILHFEASQADYEMIKVVKIYDITILKVIYGKECVNQILDGIYKFHIKLIGRPGYEKKIPEIMQIVQSVLSLPAASLETKKWSAENIDLIMKSRTFSTDVSPIEDEAEIDSFVKLCFQKEHREQQLAILNAFVRPHDVMKFVSRVIYIVNQLDFEEIIGHQFLITFLLWLLRFENNDLIKLIVLKFGEFIDHKILGEYHMIMREGKPNDQSIVKRLRCLIKHPIVKIRLKSTNNLHDKLMPTVLQDCMETISESLVYPEGLVKMIGADFMFEHLGIAFPVLNILQDISTVKPMLSGAIVELVNLVHRSDHVQKKNPGVINGAQDAYISLAKKYLFHLLATVKFDELNGLLERGFVFAIADLKVGNKSEIGEWIKTFFVHNQSQAVLFKQFIKSNCYQVYFKGDHEQLVSCLRSSALMSISTMLSDFEHGRYTSLTVSACRGLLHEDIENIALTTATHDLLAIKSRIEEVSLSIKKTAPYRHYALDNLKQLLEAHCQKWLSCDGGRHSLKIKPQAVIENLKEFEDIQFELYRSMSREIEKELEICFDDIRLEINAGRLNDYGSIMMKATELVKNLAASHINQLQPLFIRLSELSNFSELKSIIDDEMDILLINIQAYLHKILIDAEQDLDLVEIYLESWLSFIQGFPASQHRAMLLNVLAEYSYFGQDSLNLKNKKKYLCVYTDFDDKLNTLLSVRPSDQMMNPHCLAEQLIGANLTNREQLYTLQFGLPERPLSRCFLKARKLQLLAVKQEIRLGFDNLGKLAREIASFDADILICPQSSYQIFHAKKGTSLSLKQFMHDFYFDLVSNFIAEDLEKYDTTMLMSIVSQQLEKLAGFLSGLEANVSPDSISQRMTQDRDGRSINPTVSKVIDALYSIFDWLNKMAKLKAPIRQEGDSSVLKKKLDSLAHIVKENHVLKTIVFAVGKTIVNDFIPLSHFELRQVELRETFVQKYNRRGFELEKSLIISDQYLIELAANSIKKIIEDETFLLSGNDEYLSKNCNLLISAYRLLETFSPQKIVDLRVCEWVDVVGDTYFSEAISLSHIQTNPIAFFAVAERVVQTLGSPALQNHLKQIYASDNRDLFANYWSRRIQYYIDNDDYNSADIQNLITQFASHAQVEQIQTLRSLDSEVSEILRKLQSKTPSAAAEAKAFQKKSTRHRAKVAKQLTSLIRDAIFSLQKTPISSEELSSLIPAAGTIQLFDSLRAHQECKSVLLMITNAMATVFSFLSATNQSHQVTLLLFKSAMLVIYYFGSVPDKQSLQHITSDFITYYLYESSKLSEKNFISYESAAKKISVLVSDQKLLDCCPKDTAEIVKLNLANDNFRQNCLLHLNKKARAVSLLRFKLLQMIQNIFTLIVNCIGQESSAMIDMLCEHILKRKLHSYDEYRKSPAKKFVAVDEMILRQTNTDNGKLINLINLWLASLSMHQLSRCLVKLQDTTALAAFVEEMDKAFPLLATVSRSSQKSVMNVIENLFGYTVELRQNKLFLACHQAKSAYAILNLIKDFLLNSGVINRNTTCFLDRKSVFTTTSATFSRSSTNLVLSGSQKQDLKICAEIFKIVKTKGLRIDYQKKNNGNLFLYEFIKLVGCHSDGKVQTDLKETLCALNPPNKPAPGCAKSNRTDLASYLEQIACEHAQLLLRGESFSTANNFVKLGI